KSSKRALRKAAKRWERPRYTPRTEQLEDRTLLSTLNLTAAPIGVLSYSAGAGISNNLTVSVSGGNYTFTDTGETITLGGNAIAAGWTGSGTNTVTGPTSSVLSSSIDLADGTNTLTVASTADTTNAFD